MTIQFFVPGNPKPQPRPRAFARKFGDKWQARVYDAGTAEAWKSTIANEARPYLPDTPIAGAISLTLQFLLPRPKAHFGKAGQLKLGLSVLHTKRPDLDNLEKAVMDCLTQLGFWVDDSQVAIKTTLKAYGSNVGAKIKIETDVPEADALFIANHIMDL